jgi:hypothetical protein
VRELVRCLAKVLRNRNPVRRQVRHLTLERKENVMRKEFELAGFEPEVILPAQMTWGARHDSDTSGPRALMLAILADAVLCIERGRRRRHPGTRRLAGEAETWVRSDCREWLFSFASICDVLGFDADALRVRLLTKVEHPANAARAACAEATDPSTRSGAVARPPLQREGTRASFAVATARAPAGRTASHMGPRSSSPAWLRSA